MSSELHQRQIHNADDLRHAVINYIKTHSDQLINQTPISEWIKMTEMTENVGSYLEHMSHNSSWGGAPEIAIMAQMLHVQIRVQRHGKTIAKFVGDGHSNKELVLNWNGAHYNEVVE